jgi:putative addiction module component (TIGR02574 family)
MLVSDFPQITELPVPEKILFLEDLWDSVASNPETVPVPPSHVAEIERRMAWHEANPGKLLSLDQLQSRIEAGK